MTTIIRIKARKGPKIRIYYEPVGQPRFRARLKQLRQDGWAVRVRRINAEREIAYLWRAAKARYGKNYFSGIYIPRLGCALTAWQCEGLAMDADLAVRGYGSLCVD